MAFNSKASRSNSSVCTDSASAIFTKTERDSFVFADGIIVHIVQGGLQGVTKGTTYVHKYIAETNQKIAYKVVVE